MSEQSPRQRLRGLYVITDDARMGPDHISEGVAAALRGGARVVQYRDKSDDTTRRLREAQALRTLTRSYGVPLLINDDVDLALAVAADGVHLGRDDSDPTAARARLPAECLIGLSCYNRFDLAERAVAHGADYVAFGSFFPSPTKPQAVRAEVQLLRRARLELGVPTVAIGGISPENGAALVTTGADMLAVISAVFAADDVTAATKAFVSCFASAEGD